MAKEKWMPKVGESYIVRGSDNSKGSYYIGTLFVERVGQSGKYLLTRETVYEVFGPMVERHGKIAPGPGRGWFVGKAGLIPDTVK